MVKLDVLSVRAGRSLVALCALAASACRADIQPPSREPEVRTRADAGRDTNRGGLPLPPAPVPTPEPSSEADAAAIPDAANRGEVAPPVGGSSGASSIPTCGREKPDVSGIENADGLAIGPDGTIYFSRAGQPEAWVGRLRPGGGEPELQWVRIPGRGVGVWGFAVHGQRNRLYVASSDTGSIHRVDLKADPPTVELLIDGLLVPNDLAVDRGGDVYFSERGDGKIHRVTPEGIRSEVTPERLGGPNSPTALAFASDGALLAGTARGPIFRIVLEDAREQDRSMYGAYDGWANGMAFDRAGRLYVGTYEPSGQAQLARIDSSEAPAVRVLEGRHFSSIAFGRGVLDCRDLYVAMPNEAVRRIETDTPGAFLP